MGARVAAAVATDLVALRLCRPHPRRVAWALHHLAADPDGALLELSRALAFATAAWLGLGLLLVVATAVPGRVGALARRAQLVVLPAAARRLLVGAVGVGLVASPAVASARTTPTPTAPAWPVATSAAAPAPRPSTPALRTSPATPAPPAAPGWPTAPSPSAPARPSPARADHEPVVVRAGDSLWSIAAGRLDGRATDARIAAAWPAWWAANRAVVGADPDLIRPGQALQPPTTQHPRPADTASTPRGTS